MTRPASNASMVKMNPRLSARKERDREGIGPAIGRPLGEQQSDRRSMA